VYCSISGFYKVKWTVVRWKRIVQGKLVMVEVYNKEFGNLVLDCILESSEDVMSWRGCR